MDMEILAPAGSPESLVAAVRSGADAVYLGTRTLNARRSALNFDDDGLKRAAAYCRGRGVKVYLTLNTLVYDGELDEAARVIEAACAAGVDALIVQDLAVARLARECAPELELHASTQMSVHNAQGAKMLEELGFSRVVLARELSEKEIAEIAENTSISLECFVHGALCMCVSGQCYLSAMIGGRGGNRGLCAQPCRLPFSSREREYALSLKDLSLVGQISRMKAAGVKSLKIEGRMKRPEYVAAAVTACRQALSGITPDMDALAAVFSRSGFTKGYFDGARGFGMFGTRRKEDVTAASAPLLAKLAALYKDERPAVPVHFRLELLQDKPSVLTVSDEDGNTATATGESPQAALTSPTTAEKAEAAISKTGGTPFFFAGLEAEIGENLMLPASRLNALRRSVLEDLLLLRESVKPKSFIKNPALLHISKSAEHGSAELRARVSDISQLTPDIVRNASLLIIPALEIKRLDKSFLQDNSMKIAVELPRILFNDKEKLEDIIQYVKIIGVRHAIAGNLYAIKAARDDGMLIHGDFSLNIANSAALEEYERLGLCDATVSFELMRTQVNALGGGLPRGILAYGHLPLMVTRNCPIGDCKGCEKQGSLTDRKGNHFPVSCAWGVSELYNCVPLFLADRLNEFQADFFTLYFTNETSARCDEIFRLYQTGGGLDEDKTRGLYYRKVL